MLAQARIRSIDIVRGLVMVIMALDHTRDLIHVDGFNGDPTQIPGVGVGLFFTRWITHLCAPIFVFLSGVSAWLSYQKNKDAAGTRKFLLTRGIWLIILEFTIVGFGIWSDIQFRVLLWQVIAAIGFGFIILSFLCRLAPKIILLIAILGIVVLNALPILIPEQIATWPQWLLGFFQPQFFALTEDRFLIMSYPPITWTFIMLLGYGAAPYFNQLAELRTKFFLKAGLFLLILFIGLRLINEFGDSQKWDSAQSLLRSFISFINVSKYPPSLQYICLFLGLMFFLLYFFEKMQNRFTEILRVYGSVPLFYYIAHWYLLHAILFIILFLQGFTVADFQFAFDFGRPKAPNGLPLWGVYLVWIGAVILLYPLCKWYSRYKSSHPEKKWLRYL